MVAERESGVRAAAPFDDAPQSSFVSRRPPNMFGHAADASWHRSMSSLRLTGLAKRFGPVSALASATLEVRSGELLGLIGPNGAGKTTLLECAAGLQRGDGGSVSLDDALIGDGRRREALFYLADGVTPWPDQRASWMLEFTRALFGAPASSLAALIPSLHLQALLATRMRALSKGERKRVMIAAALLTPQPFLLLDEPFDGLDLRQSRDVAAVLREHAREGRGLCLSIHQLAEAARLCDRLVLLADGRTVGEGTMDELRAKAGTPRGGIEEVFLALT
jgi:ABC-2 type transport system ATP-binding protein